MNKEELKEKIRKEFISLSTCNVGNNTVKTINGVDIDELIENIEKAKKIDNHIKITTDDFEYKFDYEKAYYNLSYNMYEVMVKNDRLKNENKKLKKEIKQLQKITITKRGNYLEISVGKVNKLFKINEEFQKWIEEIK